MEFTWGAFHSTKNCNIFQNGGKWYRHFLGKFSENLEIVEILKVNHSTEILGENQMEWRLLVRNYRKFSWTLRTSPSLQKFRKMLRIFYGLESGQSL